LPNFFRKADSGQSIRVCYLGGSITEQTGWCVQSMNYFRKQLPNANFTENNSTIGGTGSQLGSVKRIWKNEKFFLTAIKQI